MELDPMPAAGFRRKNDPEAVTSIARAAVTAVLMGSYVPKPRLGNVKAKGYPGDIFHVDQETGEGINAINLKDDWGIEGLRENLPQMVRRAHAFGRKLRISFAGFAPGDFACFLAMVYSLRPVYQPDEIEFNLGCPNAVGHTIISYDPTIVREVMRASIEVMPHNGIIPLDAKFSPFERRPLHAEVCMQGVMPFYGERGIRCVVTSNTVPHQQMDDPSGNPRIAALVQDGPNAGTIVHTGGKSGGDLMLAVSCREAAAWDALLPSEVGLILVGGIGRWEDAEKLIRAGGGVRRVRGIQIGTAFMQHEDPHVFKDVMMGIGTYLL